MKRMCVLIGLLGVGMLQTAVGQTVQGSSARGTATPVLGDFSISLSVANGSVKLGSPMNITVTVTNTSKSDIGLRSGPEPAYRFFHFILRQQDQELPKTAFHRALRGENLKEDPPRIVGGSSIMFTLEPGHSVNFTLDLQRLYNITKPGSYTLIAERDDEIQKVKVRSAPLVFEIGPQ